MTIFRSPDLQLVSGFSVKFEFNDSSRRLHVEWNPYPPIKLERHLLRAYRSARNKFLSKLGHRLNFEPVVVELTPEMLRSLLKGEEAQP